MKYLVVHMTDPTGSEWDPDVDNPALESWIAEGYRDAGWAIAGSPVAGREEARSIATRDDVTTVTDGPFPELKEWFMGFDWIEAASLDEAVARVSAHPSTKIGRLYVLPAASLPEGVN